MGRRRRADFISIAARRNGVGYHFLNFTIFTVLSNGQFPESPLPTGRILAKCNSSGGRRRWADFSPIFARRNYAGLPFSIFTILPHFWESNVHIRHCRWVAFLCHSEGLQRWAGFVPISAIRNYVDFCFPILRFYRTLGN